jgi:hypothetical protein
VREPFRRPTVVGTQNRRTPVPSYRIETVTGADGMVSVEAYAEGGDQAIGSSGPVFHSEEEANQGIKGMFEMAWPAKDPFAVDSSIGV